MLPDVSPNIVVVAAGALAVMIVASAVRLVWLRSTPSAAAQQRYSSLFSWWLVILAILLATILGRAIAVALFVVVSSLALHEFFSLRSTAINQQMLRWLAYSLVLTSYVWIWLGWRWAFIAFLPLAAPPLLSAGLILVSRTQGFVAAASQACWGIFLTSYAPAFAVLLLTLSPNSNPVAGVAGWFLFLLLLTEINDIAQALVGRQLGRRPIAPTISPHKTWAGFLGGLGLSAVLAVGLASWLTPWHWLVALLAGLLISIAGLFGDLNVSALKRDCGVKDSGRLLPGQGGILDRIDSLTFTAPMFYGYVLLIDATSRTSTP